MKWTKLQLSCYKPTINSTFTLSYWQRQIYPLVGVLLMKKIVRNVPKMKYVRKVEKCRRNLLIYTDIIYAVCIWGDFSFNNVKLDPKNPNLKLLLPRNTVDPTSGVQLEFRPFNRNSPKHNNKLTNKNIKFQVVYEYREASTTTRTSSTFALECSWFLIY